MKQRIHLDVVGGIAGDMFAAAMFDLKPDLSDQCYAVVHKVLDSSVFALSCMDHTDGVLCGKRFAVRLKDSTGGSTQDHHEHRHWRDIRSQIENSGIDSGTCSTAIDIFSLLAESEAHCHGVPIDDVAFHEVGAWDSIADILIAARIIESLPDTKWTVSTLPSGSGTITTAHGQLPVPAPAVVHLLDRYIFFADGLSGERITPTGAAILKYLGPEQQSRMADSRLSGCGIGFGSKSLSGTSNVLRALLFEEAHQMSSFYDRERVLVIRFEVDDQTPEDLSVGLENLRNLVGVLDVLQSTGVGKKGRHTLTVQVIAVPAEREAVITACFTETTTLGLRWHIEDRAVLHREQYDGKRGGRTKIAHRPNGLSVKAEMDDIRQVDGGYQRRREARDAVETQALNIFRRRKPL